MSEWEGRFRKAMNCGNVARLENGPNRAIAGPSAALQPA
jgi:hypothetical protein